jgi:protein LSM14
MQFNPYNAQSSFPPGSGPQTSGQVPQQPQPQQQTYPARQLNGSNTQGQNSRNATSPPRRQMAGNGHRNGSVNSATASMETVERALGDLRVNTGAQRGGRRGGRDIKAGDLRVPATDFDFQSSNARFDKSALAPPGKPSKSVDADEEKAGASEEEGEDKAKEDDTAYDPKKSFFDQLSSSAAHPTPNGVPGGRGRGRGGRSRREEEREKNVATFGEPGGVGLMGPGAYVGGYGRRGGRPRRGSAPVVAR